MSSDGEMAMATTANPGEQAARVASLEMMYDQYAHALYRYALALVGSSEDAEDAVQEVFARLARERRGPWRIADARAYLYTATRNAAYSALRTRRRRDWLSEATTDAFRENAGFAETFAESTVLRQALGKLPVEQREVLVLKAFDELTFKEIAETTGASLSTVTSRYRYGIDKLRQALEDAAAND